MLQTIFISRAMYRQVVSRFRYRDGKESGGLLRLQNRTVTGWFRDTGRCGALSYRPNCERISQTMAAWARTGARGCFLHSHPPGRWLSAQDLAFAVEYLRLNGEPSPMPFFLLVGDELRCYGITPGGAA